ncbi:hypothetical protein Mnod_4867 [Methylobacterium nodulans ORS 2060]|uniref:Uncharacterized protein n=2 Tax=Methylobacterium nodulans TaxID=114616 RepID=B8IH35_METNO|nr:hypothetical protein Mnod_4867 [Methylobacterium nodulans ORS 2060]
MRENKEMIWEEKIEEITKLIATQLFGEGPHTNQQLGDAYEEAIDAIDRWGSECIKQRKKLEGSDTLQNLLEDQQGLADQIIEEAYIRMIEEERNRLKDANDKVFNDAEK